MKTLKLLLGFLPGVTLGMWLKAIWFCFAVCICNPADDCPLWVVFALILNVMAAGWAVFCDRERWKGVSDKLNSK